MSLATDDAFPCPWCGRDSRPADPVERLPDRSRVCDACNLVFTEGMRLEYSPQDLAAPQMSDDDLKALWAERDIERRQDGDLFRIKGDASVCPACLGVGQGCAQCHGRGYIGVPPGQRIRVKPPERDHLGRFTMPPLPDGTRPAPPAVPGLEQATIDP